MFLEAKAFEVLGSGGFGAVYRGTYLGNEVAIKKLHLIDGQVNSSFQALDAFVGLRGTAHGVQERGVEPSSPAAPTPRELHRLVMPVF